MLALMKREFLRNKTSLLVMCIISVAFAWMYIALFPSIQEQSDQINSFLKSMPEGFLKAFGVDVGGYGKIENYLATELMSFMWPITAVLLAVSRAGASVAGDIENRTIGLEMSLPVSRARVFISKVVGNWISILLFCFVSIFSIIPLCVIHGIEIKSGNVVTLFLICLVFTSAIFAVALVFSTFVSEKGRVYFAAGGFILLSYLANILAILSEGLSWLRHFSIFHYFTSSDALAHGTVSLGDAIFFISLGAFCVCLGSWRFIKRDISI